MSSNDKQTVFQAVGSEPDFVVAIQTITTGGFILDRVDRRQGCALIFAHRPDEFGASHKYCFAISETGTLSRHEIDAIQIPAQQHDSNLVLVAASADSERCFEWMHFVGLFGGAVFSTSPLESDFAAQLIQLGQNKLPVELVGKPDDLYEAYVRVALEFILGVRVIRYGQDRRFEARPDGLIVPYNNFAALYDAKAYGAGYDVSIDSIRQFSSYVRDFQGRYNSYLPRLNTFIVISTSFQQQEGTLRSRSGDLIAECGIPLCFLTSADLVQVIEMISKFPAARHSVDWRRVFADSIFDPKRVEKELAAIAKDGLVRRY
jgi:hypothetical protein